MFTLPDLFSVKGRTALVTGGATGLGAGLRGSVAQRGGSGVDRLAQGGGVRGGGEGTLRDRPLRRLRRHGRERAGLTSSPTRRAAAQASCTFSSTMPASPGASRSSDSPGKGGTA